MKFRKTMVSLRCKYKKLLLLMCFVGLTFIFGFQYQVDHCKQFEDLKKNYYSYDIKRKLNPYTVKLKISPTHLCEDKTDPYLFIMIPSATENFQKRSAIRDTWKTYGDNDKLLNEFGQRVVLAFLLGSSSSVEVSHRFKKEIATYSDIIQGDFEDIYGNLLTKMLMGFNWKMKHCSKAKYLVKVDDDAYLDIPNLIRYLQNEETKNMTRDHLFGHVHLTPFVQRDGKYSVTCEEYPFSVYDNYLSGNCYVIPTDLVSKLFELSEYFSFVYLDDIHITGTLRVVLGAELIHNPAFTLDMEESPCSFHYHKRISRTSVNVNTMHQLWSVSHNNTLCEMQSYITRIKHYIKYLLDT